MTCVLSIVQKYSSLYLITLRRYVHTQNRLRDEKMRAGVREREREREREGIIQS